MALEEILRRQMDPMVFPVPLAALAAGDRGPGDRAKASRRSATSRVRAFRLRHPGNHARLSAGAPPTAGGISPTSPTTSWATAARYPVSADWRARLVQFLAGADTLIHDAMYCRPVHPGALRAGDTRPRARRSTWRRRPGAARLILFHHEPEHDDAGDRPPPRRHSRHRGPDGRPSWWSTRRSEGLEFAL